MVSPAHLRRGVYTTGIGKLPSHAVFVAAQKRNLAHLTPRRLGKLTMRRALRTQTAQLFPRASRSTGSETSRLVSLMLAASGVHPRSRAFHGASLAVWSTSPGRVAVSLQHGGMFSGDFLPWK
mmetsp:Transcript_87702/g.228810  ORF Transcript_87702/g.228810 Transcript_87702/m.228810 type:complete len:123 (-) Transcript_87702:77-445(-)